MNSASFGSLDTGTSKRGSVDTDIAPICARFVTPDPALLSFPTQPVEAERAPDYGKSLAIGIP